MGAYGRARDLCRLEDEFEVGQSYLWPMKWPKSLASVAGILLLITGSQCTGDGPALPPMEIGFYSWQTVFQPQSTETALLQALQTRWLYVRYADIDLSPNGTPALKAPLQWGAPPPDSAQINLIPTVFIVNRVFERTPTGTLEVLPDDITRFIRQNTPEGIPIREIQMDCDWNERTRDAYFHFLQQLKNLWPGVRVSATIRLHQVKYQKKTGIPPVDRGALMLYNFDTPGVKTRNSILDTDVAAQYLNEKSQYPLPLDIALPLFSWGVVLRDQKVIGFLRGWRAGNAQKADYLTRLEKNIYRVNKDTTAEGLYFRPGDRVHIEAPEMSDLQRVLHLARPLIPASGARLLFFDLHPNSSSAFTYADLLQLAPPAH